MCGPVFESFMRDAIKRFGGQEFRVPEGGRFIKIDRETGLPLPDDANDDNVVAEFFRDGDEPIFGVTIDDGLNIAESYKRFQSGQKEVVKQVQTSTGKTVNIAPKATFGSLSSGGQY